MRHTLKIAFSTGSLVYSCKYVKMKKCNTDFWLRPIWERESTRKLSLSRRRTEYSALVRQNIWINVRMVPSRPFPLHSRFPCASACRERQRFTTRYRPSPAVGAFNYPAIPNDVRLISRLPRPLFPFLHHSLPHFCSTSFRCPLFNVAYYSSSYKILSFRIARPPNIDNRTHIYELYFNESLIVIYVFSLFSCLNYVSSCICNSWLLS